MRQKDHKERTFVIILFSPNWIFWEGLRWELVDVFCVGKCNQSLIGKIMMLLSAAIICNNLHENCFKLFYLNIFSKMPKEPIYELDKLSKEKTSQPHNGFEL